MKAIEAIKGIKVSKRTWKIAGIVVAAVVVILIALPLFININSFKPKIESELTSALGRPVTLGELSLSIFGGDVGVENVSIGDDPAFSKSPFIAMKSLRVGVEIMPLIFSKALNITEITLEEPQITLLRAANGTWNFSSLGGAHVRLESAHRAKGDVDHLCSSVATYEYTTLALDSVGCDAFWGVAGHQPAILALLV